MKLVPPEKEGKNYQRYSISSWGLEYGLSLVEANHKGQDAYRPQLDIEYL